MRKKRKFDTEKETKNSMHTHMCPIGKHSWQCKSMHIYAKTKQIRDLYYYINPCDQCAIKIVEIIFSEDFQND